MARSDSGFLVLDNGKGLRGVFSTLGAGVRYLTLDDIPLLLTPDKDEDYLSSPQFFGKTLGRFAGRHVAKGTLNGKPYSLDEEKPGSNVCLHGGFLKSFSYQPFEATYQEDKDSISLVFTRLSPDGECGFPGNLTLKVIYKMSRDLNVFSLRYEATSDEDTFVNITNHMYWNITNQEDVNPYWLTVKASKVGIFAPHSLLIGGTAMVPDALDFREGASLKVKLDEIERDLPAVGTLDHCFLFDKKTLAEPQVVLDTPKVKISCFTDFEAANIYVDSTLVPMAFKNNPHLTTMKRRGIAIEPENFPISSSILLKKGETYSHLITYQFQKK
jgi:aldose 1-epimerase